MSVGLPVLTSNISANRDVLGDKLTEMSSVELRLEAWVEKISMLCSKNVRRRNISKMCQSRILDFDINHITQQYLNLYKEQLS